MSDFVFEPGGDDGYVDCHISPYQSALVGVDEDGKEHFAPAQALFVGTQNPFNYDNDGNKVHSREQELQYGNGIVGVKSLEMSLDIVPEDTMNALKYDVHGNVVMQDPAEAVVPVYDSTSGELVNRKIEAYPDCMKVAKMRILPKLRFTKFDGDGSTLDNRLNLAANTIQPGEVIVVIAHKNPDNIAKYHMLNNFGTIYFAGSLPKDGTNRFKWSDFKFGQTVRLKQDEDGNWRSVEEDEIGEPVLSFTSRQVMGDVPPYYIVGGDGQPLWFLEQSELVEKEGDVYEFVKSDMSNLLESCDSTLCHPAWNDNGMEYPIPHPGKFIYAHKVKAKAEKYLDYLYVKNGGLAFKVCEESFSFSDTMSKIPPFYVDEVMRNKLADLNDVQMLDEYSTFIHQSEKPSRVRDCNNFNPLLADVVLNYGLEEVQCESSISVLCTNVSDSSESKLIELSNQSTKTRLNLQLEDGEVDDALKIYVNYRRKDDGHGDFHYDLYFNMQNLFNSPFEYISSVTGQPNVLILEDSYLYLPGDKYVDKGDHNELDNRKNGKVDAIQQGKPLSLYG